MGMISEDVFIRLLGRPFQTLGSDTRKELFSNSIIPEVYFRAYHHYLNTTLSSHPNSRRALKSTEYNKAIL